MLSLYLSSYRDVTVISCCLRNISRQVDNKAGAASFFVITSHHFLYHQQYNVVFSWHHVGHVQLQTPTFTSTPEKNWQNAEDDDDEWTADLA